MKNIIISVSGILAMSMLAACGQVDDADVQNDDTARRTGMALTVDVLAETDVARIQYNVTGVDCETGAALDPAVEYSRTQDLENAVLPGGNPNLEERPFDADSQHLFADAFFWLDTGCYDVMTQPLQEDGSLSEDCAFAEEFAVPVTDGETTEIVMINQCSNDDTGALDVIAALNHAPQLENIVYNPSKFVCGNDLTICATVSDPDNDPLLFTWDVNGVEVTDFETSTNEDGLTQSCATFITGDIPAGDYEVSFMVQDLINDGEGNLIPFDDILTGDQDSNDTASLPIHVLGEDACIASCECPEGFELNESGDTCEKMETIEAVLNGEFLEVCEGDRNENYGALGTRYPGGTIELGGFWGDGGFNANNGSRLNTIGIWDCSGVVNEWIGFSRCLDVEEAGEYVIGISGDDYYRFSINGDLVFENPNVNFHFRYWSLVPVTLSAGINLIEMEGYNQGGPGTFGAEIHGPFPLGSTDTDAELAELDFENNTIWSTGDQIGSTFNLGSSNGYSCDDGFALNLCGGEASCTRIERESCE